ncbi:Zn(2)-C6 fungal-type domain-containing protein [Mycena chlorophos]|uniref:Zn(2)-C6 fungal-type domain-containing protein n=1 Tax=Mycena chlorophos TaxID=658473 RepID=A0A8H6SNI8_MYCCL|nr:Zn(2)-C6 fungal-type domain-containing protein [Mycena chlorophos]
MESMTLRRLPGSCDRCSRKKIRCDRATSDGVCTNCLNSKAECTHSRRKISNHASIKAVRSAKEHVSKILSTTTIYIPSTDLAATHQILVEVAQYARSLEQHVVSLQNQLLKVAQLSKSQPVPDESPAQDEEEEPPDPYPRASALKLKDNDLPLARTTKSFQFLQAVLRHVPDNTRPMLELPWQRPEFWKQQQWERIVNERCKLKSASLVFPEKDLLDALLDLYFAKVNPILNILHPPSFHASVAGKQHIKDPHFGSLVLLACALGSRFSDDPRVLLDGTTDEHSCGWRWFAQVRPMLMMPWGSHPGSLYQLQSCCLYISFLTESCMGMHDEVWLLAGMGVRLTQALGVNTRKGPGYTRPGVSPRDAELYRRATWMLSVYDSLMSCAQGRPCFAHLEKMDLEPARPLKDNGELVEGTKDNLPAEVDVMNHYVKLGGIIIRIHETLYPVGRQRGNVSSEEIIELDSALNRWAENLPAHLNWNANQVNPIFVDQSALLYTTYYHTQIVLHRAFIPIGGRNPASSSVDLPSLSICANAARSCIRVVDNQAKRGSGILQHPHLSKDLFDAAVVLILNIIAGRSKIQTQEDYSRATVDLESCVRVLRLYEQRWRFAGRRCDAICLGLRLVKYALFDPSFALPSPGTLHSDSPPSSEDQNVLLQATSASSTGNSPPDSSSASVSEASFFVDAPPTAGIEARSSYAQRELGHDAAAQAHAHAQIQMQALEQSMVNTQHLFNGASLPSVSSSSLPMDVHVGADDIMDLEVMLGATFDPQVGMFDNGAYYPQGNAMGNGQGEQNLWTMLSSGYEWGDWNSYAME